MRIVNLKCFASKRISSSSFAITVQWQVRLKLLFPVFFHLTKSPLFSLCSLANMFLWISGEYPSFLFPNISDFFYTEFERSIGFRFSVRQEVMKCASWAGWQIIIVVLTFSNCSSRYCFNNSTTLSSFLPKNCFLLEFLSRYLSELLFVVFCVEDGMFLFM